MKKLILTIAVLFLTLIGYSQMTLEYSSATSKRFTSEFNLSDITGADTTIYQTLGAACSIYAKYDSLTLTGTGATFDIKSRTLEGGSFLSISHIDLPNTMADAGHAFEKSDFPGEVIAFYIVKNSATVGAIKITLVTKFTSK